MELPMNEDAEYEFLVFSPREKPFKVVSVRCSRPSYKVVFEPGKRKFAPARFPNLPEAERDCWVVKTTIPKTLEPGSVQGITFTIATDAERERVLLHTLTVQKGIRVVPAAIHMGVVGDPDSDRRNAMLEWDRGTFKVTGVEVIPGELDAKVETVADGHQYRLWLSPKKDLVQGTRSVKVTVTTDSPVQPTLTLNVWLSVNP
jgi:hypothetical protein